MDFDFPTCPSCRRHIRRSEASCPFCGVARPRLAGRRGLAAAYAIGLGSATIAGTSCSSSSPSVMISVPYGTAADPCLSEADYGSSCTGSGYTALSECGCDSDGGTGYAVCLESIMTFTCDRPGPGFTPLYDAGSVDAGADDGGDDGGEDATGAVEAGSGG